MKRQWKHTKATFLATIAQLERDLAIATETEWRLCWWSSLAGCGVTLVGLWLGGVI